MACIATRARGTLVTALRKLWKRDRAEGESPWLRWISSRCANGFACAQGDESAFDHAGL